MELEAASCRTQYWLGLTRTGGRARGFLPSSEVKLRVKTRSDRISDSEPRSPIGPAPRGPGGF
eukprot:509423-Hanusia_phi.AAC.1